MVEVYKSSDLDAAPTGRITSTYEELDWAYGKPGSWGIPQSRISVWSGSQGIGKTRLLTQLMKRWDRLGLVSLINQGEVPPEQFVSEKLEGYKSDNILISPSTDIFDQIEAIEQYKPAIVITDSVQQVEQYNNGKGAKEIVRHLRQVINKTKTHVIFVSQLTTEGKTKGGTTLPHECDIEAFLEFYAPTLTRSLFVLKVGKNRYGISGREIVFAHKNEGVECQSQNRLQDPEWLKEHGILTKRKKLFGLF